jgi:hypothetical protein
MNRAWIPAGALAGVSVAGLIALGPLTSSLGTQVSFHPTLAVTTPTAGHTRVVQVSVDLGASGTTATSVSAALKVRGGEATVAAATPSGDIGQVGFKRTSSSQTRAATTTVKPTAKPKKTVKRAASIGGNSGPNGDNGLAGGSSGSSSTSGGVSGTPGP